MTNTELDVGTTGAFRIVLMMKFFFSMLDVRSWDLITYIPSGFCFFYQIFVLTTADFCKYN